MHNKFVTSSKCTWREGGRERRRPGCSLNGVCQKRSMHKVRDKKTKKRSMHMVRDKKTKLVQVIF